MTKKRKIIRYLILVIIIIAVVIITVYEIFKTCGGCQPDVNLPKKSEIGVYVDEQPNNPNNLKEIKIATITVSPDGNLTLKILQNDAFNIKRLQEAVANITARPELKLISESEEIIDGQKALVMKDFSVPKTDRNYPLAVAETLNMEFGLKAKVENK